MALNDWAPRDGRDAEIEELQEENEWLRVVLDAAIETQDAQTDALEWLVHLHHDCGKAGGGPEPGEWEAAIESGVKALRTSDEWEENERLRAEVASAVNSRRNSIQLQKEYREEREQAEARIEEALALHKPRDHDGEVAPYCPECSSVSHGTTPWPCPTVKALKGEGE